MYQLFSPVPGMQQELNAKGDSGDCDGALSLRRIIDWDAARSCASHDETRPKCRSGSYAAGFVVKDYDIRE